MIVYSHSFLAMFTRFALVIPGMETGRGEKLVVEVERIVENWEACLSTFRSGAELQIINALAHERELAVSEPMGRVLNICQLYNSQTKGLFDPAVNDTGSRWEDVIWDIEKQSIRYANPNVRIDMGGIGKGIALKDVVALLRSEGVNDAFLSFGESSLAAMGKHPHGDGWLVGTKDGFLLQDEFLSISGLQNMHAAGEDASHAHIFHPLKGELITWPRRVMVKCDSPVEAEVLSTCGYMADAHEFEKLKSVFPAAQWQVD